MKAELYKKIQPQFREVSEKDAQALEKMFKCTRLLGMYLNRNDKGENGIIKSAGEYENLMVRGNRTVTYGGGAKNLLETTEKLCNNERLLKEVREMVSEIMVSSVNNVQMVSHWNIPKKQSDLQLDASLIDVFVTNMYLLYDLKLLKELSEETGITTDALKQACQQNRLLTATKSGRAWLASINEVKSRWRKVKLI